MHNFLLFACISVGETHLIATLLRVFLLPLDLHFFRGRGYEENRKVKAPSIDGFYESQSISSSSSSDPDPAPFGV